jgi:hypothetical protein
MVQRNQIHAAKRLCQLACRLEVDGLIQFVSKLLKCSGRVRHGTPRDFSLID